MDNRERNINEGRVKRSLEKYSKPKLTKYKKLKKISAKMPSPP